MTTGSRFAALGTVVSFALVPLLLFGADLLSVPGNLKVEGIPQIPSALMETLARYGESRAATLQDWHPQRREMLIGTRFGDVAQVHRVAMPGGARAQLTFYPEPAVSARYRPPNGDSFVFEKDLGGNERFQIFLYDVNTGEARLVTDGLSRNGGAHWSHNGRRLVYTSTRRNGTDSDIYVGDPSNLDTTRRLLQVEGGGWLPLGWSPDDRSIVVQHYVSVTESSLYIVDVSTGAKTLVTPEGEKASYGAYGNAHFSPDGKRLYLTTDSGSEFHRLAVLDLASRKVAFVRPDVKWDVERLAVAKNGRRLAYVLNEDGAETLHVIDLRTNQDASLPKLPFGTIAGIHWHDNSRDLGFSLTSARSPSDVYSIDVETGKLDRWTTSETGGLNAAGFSEPELVRWKSFGGLTISGFLYRPPKKFAGPRPVIIDIHGGPEGQSKPGFLARNNYYLNDLGVTVIFPNVRGSSGYGKTYSMLDNGMKREDAVKDMGETPAVTSGGCCSIMAR